jgi:hypothetical protein
MINLQRAGRTILEGRSMPLSRTCRWPLSVPANAFMMLVVQLV